MSKSSLILFNGVIMVSKKNLVYVALLASSFSAVANERKMEAHEVSFNRLQPQQLSDNKDIRRIILTGDALEHRRDLGNLVVHHGEEGFSVQTIRTEVHPVDRTCMDKDLRSMKPDTLAKLVASGSYLSVNQKSDGKYTLDLKHRVKGGGPITGAIFGWGTRILAYGCLGVTATAATAAVVTTGGMAGAGLQAVVVGVVNGGSLAAGGATAALAANTAVAEVASLAGASIVVEAAALGASTVAYIEMGATAAQIAGTAIWFLP